MGKTREGQKENGPSPGVAGVGPRGEGGVGPPVPFLVRLGALPGEGQPFRAQKSEEVPSRPHLTEGNSGDPGPQPGPGPSPRPSGRVRKQRAHSAGGRAGGSREASAMCKPREGHDVIAQSHPSLQRLQDDSTESGSRRHNRFPWGACGGSSAELGIGRETWLMPLSLRPSRPQL